MRLEITRKSDLATRALIALASSRGRMKAGELAAVVEASTGFLTQAMTPVVAAGWVRSEPGPTGGYTLTVDPAGVSVLQVIEAVEGRTDAGRCVLQNRPCSETAHCALHGAWTRARSGLLNELASTSLASLVPSPPTARRRPRATPAPGRIPTR